MANRLSPRESMYYFLDPTGATSHLGALLILDGDPRTEGIRDGSVSTDERPPSDNAATPTPNSTTRSHHLDYPSLVSLVENRLQLAPRYRQIVRPVTMGLARPVWADDPDFDINFHIRRSGLPRPGTMRDLADLIARVMSRPLDRSRPLWEMYLIEGLSGDGYALLTKSHRCLVDDFAGPEISQIIVDETADVVEYEPDLWMPGQPPGSTALAVGAIADAVTRPGEVIDSVITSNGVIGGVRTVLDSTVRRVGSIIREMADSAPQSPLTAHRSLSQTFAVTSVPRRECAKIAERHECTVNDVVLAIISGVMRRWLLSFDVAAAITDTVRVEIPLATRDPGVSAEADRAATWIDVGTPGFVTDLPVGEDNPTVRLAQVAGLADRYSQSSRRVTLGPRPILAELGMVPFAEFSSWAFRSLGTRGYHVPMSITDSPVADRYVLGRKVTGLYSVPGLIDSHALSIGVVEYCDRLHIAFIADQGVIGDLPALADYVIESFDELVDAD